MARVSITVPDGLLGRVRAAGLNVSRVFSSALPKDSSALPDELDRREKVAGLDAHLAELEAELGPTSAEERAATQERADRVLPSPDCRIGSAHGARTA